MSKILDWLPTIDCNTVLSFFMPAPVPDIDQQLKALFEQLKACSADIKEQMVILEGFNKQRIALGKLGRKMPQKDELQAAQHLARLKMLKERNADLLQQYNTIQAIKDKSEVLDTTRDTVQLVKTMTSQTKRKLASVGGARQIVAMMEDTADTMEDVQRVTNAVARAMSPYGMEEVHQTGEVPPLALDEELAALFEQEDTDLSLHQYDSSPVAASSVPVSLDPVPVAPLSN